MRNVGEGAEVDYAGSTASGGQGFISARRSLSPAGFGVGQDHALVGVGLRDQPLTTEAAMTTAGVGVDDPSTVLEQDDHDRGDGLRPHHDRPTT